MSITELNKIHPVKLLIHLVDDDKPIRKLIGDLLKLHGMPNYLELNDWEDPQVYTSFMDAHPEVLPNICIFDMFFKDEDGNRSALDGLDLTRTLMKRAEDKDENAKPKVIMISGGNPSAQVIEEFVNADGYRFIRKRPWDMPGFKKDLLDALNTAVLRTKKALENLAFFDSILQMEYKKLEDYKPPVNE